MTESEITNLIWYLSWIMDNTTEAIEKQSSLTKDDDPNCYLQHYEIMTSSISMLKELTKELEKRF